jgi:caffeoyl-CoA O-methyltransferase
LELIHPQVQQYAENYSSPEDPLLREISEYTFEYNADPQMLSGHLQGKVLEMISCMIRPRRILEIGTFTGYSAVCLAKGLTDDGILHTIELRESEAEKAKSFFEKGGYSQKIIVHTGNALEVMKTLNETWDLVFIDADKPGYQQYFNQALPNVRKNGFILADNIFFHGEVLQPVVKGKSAKGIAEFNDFIKAQKGIEKVILTIRDGLFLIRKL